MTNLKSPKVLVVDDDEDACYLLQVALTTAGFQVITAENGRDTLAVLETERPDIILLDLNLPDIDGIALCRRIHDCYAALPPPILMITGTKDDRLVNEAFEAQVTDFITKPVNFTILKNRIKRILREQETLKKLETVNLKLTKISQTDSLTNLANRHHFQIIFFQEWARSIREQQSLGLLLCDLDAFKQYNDHYGHLSGDACLQQFAAILKASVNRITDLVARFGGEEFIILLPNTDTSGIRKIDNRLRQQLADAAILHGNSRVDKLLTYSAGGIAIIPHQNLLPNDLIGLADRALYKAKANGRNCTVMASGTAGSS
ncbi:diguanylate cyclase domain-containing protein [Halomicronema sp. CCY15110]|uniref:GGDEF domain-containing protein n=1 Tax=Halomicronema sp. CCY15110 TaxID=2767773 RepID=UPI00194F5B85|nr:diguanylate cyclase [Halomicronema sp. CCY15110]